MTDINMQDFEQRCARLVRTHRGHARGNIHVTQDGRLLRRDARPRLPIRRILSFLLLGLVLKAALFNHAGPEAYQVRIAALSGWGSAGEVAAWVARPGIATVWLAGRIDGVAARLIATR